MSNQSTERKSTKDITITDLNEDCIRQVGSNLAVIDKINLMLASDRIDNILCSDIDLSQIIRHFDVKQIKEILSRAGPHIKKFHYDKSNEPLESLIEIIFHAGKCCSNVQELNFTFFHNEEERDFRCPDNFILPFDQLQILQLKNCKLSDVNFKEISTLTHLKHLNLSFNNLISGKYLDNLKNISHLNLTGCENFQSEQFIAICSSNKFKELSILGCSKLNCSAIDALIETQTDLEKVLFGKNENADIKRVCQLKNLSHLQFINLFDDTGLSVFTEAVRFQSDLIETLVYRGADESSEDERVPQEALKIKNLKKLVIDSVYIIDEFEFLEKISRNCNQLEEIRLTIGCTDDNNSGHLILEVLKNLQQLKILHIRTWPAMNSTLFNEIVAAVKKRKSIPLRISVCEAEITPEFLETEEYLRSKDFVILTFDRSYTQYDHSKYFGPVCLSEYDEVIIFEKYVAS